jgi:hypothetical protein
LETSKNIKNYKNPEVQRNWKISKNKPISDKCVALGMTRNATKDVFRFFP